MPINLTTHVKARILALGLILLMSLLASCTRPACPTTPHQKAKDVLIHLRKQREPVHSLRAEARIERFERGKRVKLTVWMLVARPSDMRLDVMTQLGPIATLTTTKSTFTLSDTRKQQVYLGAPCPSNIARLLGISMPSKDVIRLFLGDTPLLPATQTALQCNANGNYQITRTGTKGNQQIIEVRVLDSDIHEAPSKQRLTLVSSSMQDANNRVLWRLDFDKVKRLPVPAANAELWLPHRVHVQDYVNDTQSIIRFQDIDLNPAMPDTAFQQSPPASFEQRHLNCDEPYTTPAP